MTLSDFAMNPESPSLIAAFAAFISTPTGALAFIVSVASIAWLAFVLFPPRRVPGRQYPGDAVTVTPFTREVTREESALRAIASTPAMVPGQHPYPPLRSFTLPAAKGFRAGQSRVIHVSAWRRS